MSEYLTPQPFLPGREIVESESVYLPFNARVNLRRVYEATVQRDEDDNLFDNINYLAAALPHSEYGHNILGKMVQNTTDLTFPAKGLNGYGPLEQDPEAIKQRRFARRTNLEKLKRNIEVTGIYYLPTGYLGFSLNDGYGIVFNITDRYRSKRGLDKTTPYFRDPVTGLWLEKDFTVRGAEDLRDYLLLPFELPLDLDGQRVANEVNKTAARYQIKNA